MPLSKLIDLVKRMAWAVAIAIVAFAAVLAVIIILTM
jgi:hypothetical protein